MIDTVVKVSHGDATQEIKVEIVTDDYLDDLGVSVGPNGRALTSTRLEVVISDAFRKRAFANRGDVIGSTVTLNGSPAVIAAIASPGFRGLTGRTDAWVSLRHYGAIMSSPKLRELGMNPEPGAARGLIVVPRDRAAAVPAMVDLLRARLRASGALLSEEDLSASMPFALDPAARQADLAEARLYQTLSAVALVFALLNFLILTATRNGARDGEFALRIALGARRRSLVAAAFVGSLLDVATVAIIASVMVATAAKMTSFAVGLDSAGVAALILAAVWLVAATGRVPRVPDPATALRNARATQGPRTWVHSVLQAFQVAASVVAITNAGWTIADYLAQQRVLLGVLPAGTEALLIEQPDAIAMMQFLEQDTTQGMIAALKDSIRGVLPNAHIAVADYLPGTRNGNFNAGYYPSGVVIEATGSGTARTGKAQTQFVDSNLFSLLGVPVLAGALPDPNDRGSVILSETLARALFGSTALAVRGRSGCLRLRETRRGQSLQSLWM